VRCAGEERSYGELDRDANGVARALIEMGIGRGDRVGLFLDKGIQAITGLYGAMKAGAAYVPIDPRGPAARGGLVGADCQIGALITTPELGPSLLGEMAGAGHAPRGVIVVGSPGSVRWPEGIEVVSYDRALEMGTEDPPGVPVVEADLAYILYTSGSTGVPKGVMLTHRNALAFVEWAAETIGVGDDDVMSSHAPLHFDLSVFDLYVAALAGATVVVVPADEAYLGRSLADVICRESITTWYSVPSALMLLTRSVTEPGELPSLRTVVFAGEVYPTKHLRDLRRLLPGVTLWNIYGPTETNVITAYQVLDLPEDDRTIPIGRACANTDVFVVRDDGGLAGVGEEGELYARGPTVMKGYWNRPERTAEVLVQNQLFPHLPDPAYRTGDIVRVRPDGDLDFLGRRDHQIKSRGYRIDLGEVEAAMSSLPGVEEAVAVALDHQSWGTQIVACVIARDGEALTENTVRRHVAGRLPRYMVPTRVRILATFPRTSTGKVDRRAIQSSWGSEA
jgi:amino acid adenylation domain-containing protein